VDYVLLIALAYNKRSPQRRGRRDRGDNVMTVKNDEELANTERKLAELDSLISSRQNNSSAAGKVEIHSLTGLANELREEIARYKASSRREAARR
jgi:hypothetical protein